MALADYDERRIQDDAATIRDLEDLGAVHLDKTRTIGFERRPMRRSNRPRQTSPGSGQPPADYDWLRY